MEEIFEIFDLTKNEAKVYEALLKIKKGTKTPIVRESGVLSSKVYEVLDRLIKKGLVTSFVENKVNNYVPVHPSNVKHLFDEKIKKIENQKKEFEKKIKELFPKQEKFVTDVQLFRNWDGLRNALIITNDDFDAGDTYYILGASPGEDITKATKIFSQNDKRLYNKKVNIKAIHDVKRKVEAEEYLNKYGRKNWAIRYYATSGPFQVGITNNYTLLILLEKDPITILINNKKIRDSFYHYFEMLWKQAKK